MAWAYLAAAAVFEIVFALSMKYADGFTRLLPTLVTAASAVGGIGFLTLAMKTLPVSVAYPIWTGVGTLGTVLLGCALHLGSDRFAMFSKNARHPRRVLRPA